VYFKPLSIDWFYARVFLRLALENPEHSTTPSKCDYAASAGAFTTTRWIRCSASRATCRTWRAR